MADASATVLHTTAGDVALHECQLRLGGRAWTILHTGALITPEDEGYFFRDHQDRLPYGVALWPAAIALAHDVVARAGAMRGARVLELGAGTGLPGLVAASLGARVVQTDRHELALAVCRRNAERNAAGNAAGDAAHGGVAAVEHRLADWADWHDTARYDVILGSDILYAESMHAELARIFATNLAAGGRVLLADPFRAASLRLLERLAADGWTIALSKWTVGDAAAPRAIGVYELAAPGDRAGGAAGGA